MISKMCCISLTQAVKLIGTFGLSLSILMINMLVSNFFSSKEENEFVIALESWMLFGLNWTYVMKSMKVAETARTLLICVLIYSGLFVIANALLAIGSLLKKPAYALPWMYVQMVSIIDQTIALAMHLTNSGDRDEAQDSRAVWYIPACSIYLLISSYFWMIVSSARREWIKKSEDYDNFASGLSTPETDNTANMPKTPSFVSSNTNNVALVFGESPDRAYVLPPPKYNIV